MPARPPRRPPSAKRPDASGTRASAPQRGRGRRPPPPDALFDAFAIAAPGLEPLVARELGALHVDAHVAEGGVEFRGDLTTVLRANLHLRTASRVLVRVASFRVTAFHELERLARAVPWERFVGDGEPVRFKVTTRKSRLYHSDAVAQRLVHAVAHRLGGAEGGVSVPAPEQSRSSPPQPVTEDDDAETPGQLFVVRVANDVCTISADSSGTLLHRRGYRQAIARAPLRETLAAALLLALDYTGSEPLVDPFCGSGTIPIEAALIARGMAPGLNRDFRCERWPGVQRSVVVRVRKEARAMERPATGAAIIGADRDAGAIAAARANADRAGVAGDVEFVEQAFSALEPPGATGCLVTNPPYGVRVGDDRALRDLYARIGQLARSRLGGWRLAILSGNPRLDRQLRLPLREIFRSTNGGLAVRLLAGSATVGGGPGDGVAGGTPPVVERAKARRSRPRNRDERARPAGERGAAPSVSTGRDEQR